MGGGGKEHIESPQVFKDDVLRFKKLSYGSFSKFVLWFRYTYCVKKNGERIAGACERN